MADRPKVIVLNSEHDIVERVSPAVARYALRHGGATLILEDPCTIRLPEDVQQCPKPPSSRTEIVRLERQKLNTFYNPAQAMVDTADYFEKIDRKNGGDGIVWAKSTAPRGYQVIIEIKNASDRPILLPAIRPGTPLCVSKYVGNFELIRNAEQIHQNVSNGNIKLMTSEEARQFFDRKAQRLRTTGDELMKQADNESRQGVSSWGRSSSTVDQNQSLDRPIDSGGSQLEDLIHPRIDDLCNQVAPWVKPDARISAKEMFSTIYDLEDSLTVHDYMRLQAGGYYPTIKKFAEAKLKEMHTAPADDLEGSEESENA